MSLERYLAEVRRVLEHLERTQAGTIRAVAEAVAEVVAGGGVVHVFGAGHAHLVAEEAFARAGGLVPVVPILDPAFLPAYGFLKTNALENLPGLARTVLEHHDARPGEVLVVHSQSGRNVAPVEMALAARERGLRVVAITSLAHSRSVPSLHPSGLHLYEVADWVVDNGCPAGDAAVEVAPGGPRVAPLSTVAGAVVWNAIVAEVGAILAARGAELPFWESANVPGGRERMRPLWERYRERWGRLA